MPAVRDPETPLRVALLAHYPSAGLVPESELRREHADGEHPASWVRAVCQALDGQPNVMPRVFVHGRAARTRRTAVDGPITIEFLPRRLPVRIAPLLLHWPTTLAVAAALRDFNPHVVHAFGTEHCYGPAAVRLRYPCVVSTQGIVGLLRPYLKGNALAWAVQERLERYAIRRADRVIAETPFVKQWVLSIAPQAQVTVLPTPVNEEFFAVPAAPKPPGVLCVGSFSPWKNMMDVVRAFAGCGVAEATLTMIGDGPERSACEALAARLGVAARTRFTGFLPRTAVIRELARARVLALATRMDSAPNVLVEAHAAGVPVVATACGGVPDLVRDGVDGFVTAPGDPLAMGKRLGELLRSPETAAAMGEAGRRFVATRYAPAAAGRRLAALYRELGGHPESHGMMGTRP